MGSSFLKASEYLQTVKQEQYSNSENQKEWGAVKGLAVGFSAGVVSYAPLALSYAEEKPLTTAAVVGAGVAVAAGAAAIGGTAGTVITAADYLSFPAYSFAATKGSVLQRADAAVTALAFQGAMMAAGKVKGAGLEKEAVTISLKGGGKVTTEVTGFRIGTEGTPIKSRVTVEPAVKSEVSGQYLTAAEKEALPFSTQPYTRSKTGTVKLDEPIPISEFAKPTAQPLKASTGSVYREGIIQHLSLIHI